MRRSIRIIPIVALLASGLATAAPAGALSLIPEREYPAGDDATVVAVIDSGMSPYHWDFLGSKMPQNNNASKRDDVPTNVAPHKWLDGFPPPQAFDSYSSIDLTLEEKEAKAPIAGLVTKDAKEWAKVKLSTRKKVHYNWIPGTKVIGALDFGDNSYRINDAVGTHGQGTTSVSVGNLHGTCPECLLVFIEYSDPVSGEAAIEWALKQPWIDAISNSYGFSLLVRDRIYSKSDTQLQRAASERGQTIFFSAGNGQANTFTVPNGTLLSSQEGPDWIVTVGAVSPGSDNYYGDPAGESDHGSYTGHGKPADIAGIGSDYPSAYGEPTVGGTATAGFGGTSNATPTIAGTYARGLYFARQALKGPSRVQSGGVIAKGRYRCASVRRDCELDDGKLTVEELRTRLFHGAVHTPAGMTPTLAAPADLPPLGDDEFMNEGHGSYFGRETGKTATWHKEFLRFFDPILGRAKTIKRPEGERDWMIVDSWCRQHIWGAWPGGYYLDGTTKLPEAGPGRPLLAAYQQSCNHLQPPP